MKPPSDKAKPWGDYAPGLILGLWIALLHSLPQGRAWRRLALWLRKPIKSLLGEWADVSIWGLKLRLRAKGNLSEQRMILMPQFLDSEERIALEEKMIHGGVFLDIGANAGAYSLWIASRRFPHCRIEAFEPDADLCAGLLMNIERNNLIGLNVHQFALGNREGTLSLEAGEGNLGESKVSETGAGRNVRVTKLSSFLCDAGIHRVVALKIDVEGYEMDVLKPFFLETSPEVWPELIVCEHVQDDQQKLPHLLAQHGYSMTTRCRLNVIYSRPQPIP